MWPFTRDKERKAARKARRRRAREAAAGPPAFLQDLDPRYVAPQDHTVWAWLKQVPQDYFVEGWAEHDPDGFEDFRLWPRAERPIRKARAIRKHVLDLILEASAAQYPQEFGACLRAEKGVIEEIVLLPGTVAGDSHAIFQFHMLPVDLDIVGTIHSHPSPVPYPSAADTELFERYGRVHIITGHPYGRTDWNAFDHRSHLVDLRVID